MIIKALGTLVTAALIATPALAQDVAPAFDGPRIELRGGWDNPKLDLTVTDGAGSISRDASTSGFSYGGELGYDARIGTGMVIGGYVGLEESTAKECGELYGVDQLCLRAGRSITAGARVGATVTDAVMLYGKGGYSNTRATVDYQDFELILADFKEGRNFDGFHLGAGVEATLSSGIYGRLEYVYSNFGSASASINGDTASLKPTRHQVVYGMGFRF